MATKQKTAYEAAVALLARHLMSEGDLTAKLTAKQNWSSEEIGEAIAHLKKIGALRDDLLAENLVSSLRDRGYGPTRIRMQLKKHKFGSELTESVMDGDPDDDAVQYDELDGAMTALGQKASQLRRETDSRKRKGKGVRFLQSRGFSLGTALQAYDKWAAEEGQSEGDIDEWN